VVALLFSSYMLFDPSVGVSNFMELTFMTWDFKMFILALGVGYIAVAWTAENYLLPGLAKYLGQIKTSVTGKAKVRKQYKVIMAEMQTLQ
jgi:cation-transporting P-type ATPase 13A2